MKSLGVTDPCVYFSIRRMTSVAGVRTPVLYFLIALMLLSRSEATRLSVRESARMYSERVMTQGE